MTAQFHTSFEDNPHHRHGQTPKPEATHTSKEGPASEVRELPSLSELITVQWQREREDLDLQNFLLAIYFMRLGTLVDRAYDRHCQKHYGVNGGDMRLMLALRRSGPS